MKVTKLSANKVQVDLTMTVVINTSMDNLITGIYLKGIGSRPITLRSEEITKIAGKVHKAIGSK